MAKQVSSGELSLIVTQLLMNPEGIGELDELKTLANFTRDIAEVVAQYCGGEVGDVGVNDECGFQNPKGQNVSSPFFVSIYPCDNLPSLERNVWSSFDEFGWEDENPDDYALAEGQPPTLAERSKLNGILTSNMLKTATEQAVLLETESSNTSIQFLEPDSGEYKTLEVTLRDMSITVSDGANDITLGPKSGKYGNNITVSAYCDDDHDDANLLAIVNSSGAYIDDECADVRLVSQIKANSDDSEEEEEDLLDTPELIPDEVQAILAKYELADTYDELDKLISELNAVGYTAEYDLSAGLYGLQKDKG